MVPPGSNSTPTAADTLGSVSNRIVELPVFEIRIDCRLGDCFAICTTLTPTAYRSRLNHVLVSVKVDHVPHIQ